MRSSLFLAAVVPLFLSAGPCPADDVLHTTRVVANVAYKTGAQLSAAEQSRCQLDLYLPAERHDFPALVWFHGGGLTGGSKDDGGTVKIAEQLARDGVAVAVVDYRLSPEATYPAYLEDGAAAFAWMRSHAAEQGIQPTRIFIGGHSAGGYLAAMLGLDERWLQAQGWTPAAIAGLIPISGQMMTHFTVRAERGIPDRNTITADEAAPINHLHQNTPPFLILFADQDWPARREENLYFAAALRATGNERVQTLQIDHRTHGSIGGNIAQPGDAAGTAILRFMNDPVNAAQD